MAPGSWSDAELARRCREGRPEAWREMIRRFSPLAYRLSARVLGAGAEAEDAVQDTYVSAWRALPRLRDPGAVLGWLCRITRNLATDRVRRLQRRHADSLDRDVAEDRGAIVVREPRIGHGAACLRGVAHLSTLPRPPDAVTFLFGVHQPLHL